MLNPHIQHVPLEKAYRLLTHGPTVLVSSKDHKETDVMAAAWACALEFDPAKVTVVLDKSTKPGSLLRIRVISPYRFPLLNNWNSYTNSALPAR